MKERTANVTMWVEDAVRVTTHYSDFKSGIADWKECFYEIWRYQMTWDFAYEIKVYELRDRDLVVSVLVKKAFKKSAIGMMESIGYGNLRIEDEPVGMTCLIDTDDPTLEGIYTVVDDS